MKAQREAHPSINGIIDYINIDNLPGFQLFFCQTMYLQFETEWFDIETEIRIDMEVLVDYIRDLNYSDLILTVWIFSLCKDKSMDFM